MSAMQDGSTPLHLAVLQGSVPLVQCLLRCNADVSLQNRHGDTPLHYAYLTGDNALIRYSCVIYRIVRFPAHTALAAYSKQRRRDRRLSQLSTLRGIPHLDFSPLPVIFPIRKRQMDFLIALANKSLMELSYSVNCGIGYG